MTHKHYLHKEIFEQKDIVKSLQKKFIYKNEVVFKELVKVEKKLKSASKIIISGCGSSFNAALHTKQMIDDLLSVDCEVIPSSEFENFKKINNKTLFIVISQSGETSDVLRVLKEAKKKKAFTLSFLNNIESSIGKISDKSINVCAGEEVAMTATKSYSSTIYLLNLFVLHLGVLRKDLSKASVARTIKELDGFERRLSSVLKKEDEFKKLASHFYRFDHFIFLGKGGYYPLSRESALKIKESTYVHAEAFPAEEFVHGPMAIIDKNYLLCFFIPHDEFFVRNYEVVLKVKAAKAKIIILTDKKDKKLEALADKFVTLPRVTNYFYPILNLVAIQMLAYHIALKKGIRVDKPRNLTKFVLKNEKK